MAEVIDLKPSTVRDWLYAVKDPEIPTVSVVDLGVVTDVQIRPSGQVFVEMIPTFSGCPAIQLMRLEIESVLAVNGVTDYEVVVNHNKAWSSNYVTALGRKQLLDFGLSPPPVYAGEDELEEDALQNAMCPNCRSTNTTLQTPFGPTLCRAIHHCNQCGETFEQFKPV